MPTEVVHGGEWNITAHAVFFIHAWDIDTLPDYNWPLILAVTLGRVWVVRVWTLDIHSQLMPLVPLYSICMCG